MRIFALFDWIITDQWTDQQIDRQSLLWSCVSATKNYAGLEFGHQGWDLSLKVGIKASRLGFGP